MYCHVQFVALLGFADYPFCDLQRSSATGDADDLEEATVPGSSESRKSLSKKSSGKLQMLPKIPNHCESNGN